MAHETRSWTPPVEIVARCSSTPALLRENRANTLSLVSTTPIPHDDRQSIEPYHDDRPGGNDDNATSSGRAQVQKMNVLDAQGGGLVSHAQQGGSTHH